MITVPNSAERRILEILKNNFSGLTLHLYKANVTLDEDTEAADLNPNEADFPEYASINLTTWGGVSTNANGEAEVNAGVKTFTRGAGVDSQQIYGYFVKNFAGELMWAEANPAGPQTIDTEGQTYSVFVRFLLRQIP